jgi:hypothetical protein
VWRSGRHSYLGTAPGRIDPPGSAASREDRTIRSPRPLPASGRNPRRSTPGTATRATRGLLACASTRPCDAAPVSRGGRRRFNPGWLRREPNTRWSVEGAGRTGSYTKGGAGGSPHSPLFMPSCSLLLALITVGRTWLSGSSATSYCFAVTLMLLGLTSSALGRVRVRRPSL